MGPYVYPDCYLNLLKNFDEYNKSPLKFSIRSKYVDAKKVYPNGILVNNIEIHFLHYTTEQEAAVKWRTRVASMYRDMADSVPIYVKIDDRDDLSSSHIEQFMLLPFTNKISIGIDVRNYLNHITVKTLKDPLGYSVVNGKDLFRKRNKYFDMSLWLKSGIVRKTLISNIFAGRIF